MTESVAKATLKLPVKLGRLDMPSAKGTVKDQRLLVAYCTAAADIAPLAAQPTSRRASSSPSDGEDFLSVIKGFFKQLMP
jgi:hypothetical protein